ncbi:hypothetical protein AALO_G00092420 [Alosa alosa]|uniref:Uncharacterized protein n=1 Tax=Alosa alosa TaxID=278164 RepID=A0AAV6GWH2_9TELE|nr:hypothetical protein AALO_G00092420 [Alosa alosa]
MQQEQRVMSTTLNRREQGDLLRQLQAPQMMVTLPWKARLKHYTKTLMGRRECTAGGKCAHIQERREQGDLLRPLQAPQMMLTLPWKAHGPLRGKRIPGENKNGRGHQRRLLQ